MHPALAATSPLASRSRPRRGLATITGVLAWVAVGAALFAWSWSQAPAVPPGATTGSDRPAVVAEASFDAPALRGPVGASGPLTGELDVTNTGSGEAQILLSADAVVPGAEPDLMVKLRDGSHTVYRGTIAQLEQLDLGRYAAGERRSYEVTVQLGAHATASQRAEATVRFDLASA